MDEGASDTPTQRAAEEARSGQPAAPLETPGPERKASDLRNDAAEEERRQKLRQVCSCTYLYQLLGSMLVTPVTGEGPWLVCAAVPCCAVAVLPCRALQ